MWLVTHADDDNHLSLSLSAVGPVVCQFIVDWFVMVDWRWDKIERRRIQLCNQSTWCICSSASDIMDSLYPLFHILSTTLLVLCLPHRPPVSFNDNSKVRNALACTLHPMYPGPSQSTVIGNGRGAVIDQLFCCIHTLWVSEIKVSCVQKQIQFVDRIGMYGWISRDNRCASVQLSGQMTSCSSAENRTFHIFS